MRFKRAPFALLLVLGALVAPASAGAEITRMDLTSVESPTFGGRSFGDVGQYERLKGTAHGQVDPNDPSNAGIALLSRAPRNAQGMVEYSVDVDVLRPVEPARGNGRMLYDVVNRGNKLALRYMNFGGGNDPRTAADAGDGYLMDEGYTIVWSAWQGDIAAGGDALTASFPVARAADGSPYTGESRDEWVFDNTTDPVVANLAYPVADIDPTRARLTVRQNEADARQTPTDLTWTYVGDRQISIDRPAGFDAGAIYELVYPARDPIVMGLALAATRDVVSFLRYENADTAGTPNPLARGGLASHAIGMGVSQSGRMLRDLLWQGFNEDEAGRRVFDGLLPIIAGSRRSFTNFPFAQPGRFSRQHEDHLQPGDQFPFAYPVLTDPISGRTDGILARCSRTRSCPKIAHVDSDSELYQARGSLVVTDAVGRPIRQPAGVRVYQLAGTQHGPAATPARGNCQNLSNPLDFRPLRAILRGLDRWTADGVRPPASRYPSVRNGTLVEPSRVARMFPTIPGVTYTGRVNGLRLTDYTALPPTEGEPYPVLIAPVDRDGNPRGGVRNPDLSVPLATYGGWNVRREGFAPGELCSVTGSYIPFAATRAERRAAGDSRLSLEERYRDHEEYVGQVTTAAGRLVRQRLLLARDISYYVEKADRLALPNGE